MPDTRSRRGPHPKDHTAFAPAALPALRQAVLDLSWLLTRGYSSKASTVLVGDRYKLRDRQRQALQRCAASDQACERRRRRMIEPADLGDAPLWIDGYNALLTVEAAMSGGLILLARDSVYRDLAALSRHYRSLEVTGPALEAIGDWLTAHASGSVTWLLDRPISNSGRLGRFITGLAEQRGWRWRVDLVASPDRILRESTDIVATADSAILDRCCRWLNLARHVVDAAVPGRWLIDLSTTEPDSVDGMGAQAPSPAG